MSAANRRTIESVTPADCTSVRLPAENCARNRARPPRRSACECDRASGGSPSRVLLHPARSHGASSCGPGGAPFGAARWSVPASMSRFRRAILGGHSRRVDFGHRERFFVAFRRSESFFDLTRDAKELTNLGSRQPSGACVKVVNASPRSGPRQRSLTDISVPNAARQADARNPRREIDSRDRQEPRVE